MAMRIDSGEEGVYSVDDVDNSRHAARIIYDLAVKTIIGSSENEDPHLVRREGGGGIRSRVYNYSFVSREKPAINLSALDFNSIVVYTPN